MEYLVYTVGGREKERQRERDNMGREWKREYEGGGLVIKVFSIKSFPLEAEVWFLVS